MTDGSSSSSSSSTHNTQLSTLGHDVASLRMQLAEVLQAVLAGQSGAVPSTANPSAAEPSAEPSGPANSQPLSSAAVYQLRKRHFTLPPPSASSIAETFAARQAYGETGKLNLFEKPRTLAPSPSTPFIPEPDGLFHRIKSSDTRDGWEAEVIWDLGYKHENALAASHKIAEALAAGNIATATEAFSVLHHFLLASYERIQERVEFFADSIESGKSEAILLQKYLREDDHPYSSSLYRSTKSKFAELRSQAFAKELNKKNAQSKSRTVQKGQGSRSGKPSPSGKSTSSSQPRKN